MPKSSSSHAPSTLTPSTPVSEALAQLFPPLRQYCPLLETISKQQALFLTLPNREAFYGGAAGGGKSAALLTAALRFVDVPGYRALILRRTFAQLSKGDALIPLSLEWLKNTDAVWNEQKKVWTFPSQATVEFGHVEHENAKYDYQGAAYQFVGFDELTQFTESQYEYIAFSRQRRRTSMAELGIPIHVRSTANPGGEGHGWVKRRFIDKRKAGVAFVPAKVADNPGLDVADYSASLRELSPVLRQQLLDGDWGAFEGAAYPQFDRKTHVVPAMDLPDSWLRFEAMDHGVTNPTAWHLFASDYDGNLIVADSYYAKGLPHVHADAVLSKRADWWEAREDNWPVRHNAYGDPASLRESLPTKNDFGQPLTLQEIYQDLGLHLIPANNRRKAGFISVSEWLTPDPERLFPLWHERAGEPGAPRLYIVDTCADLIDQIEVAPIAQEGDPEIGEAVDRKWESAHGHAHAALRYGVTTRARPSEEPVAEPDDPRDARWLEVQRRLDKTDEPIEDPDVLTAI